MADKEYVCAYKHCLHHGERVKSSESVVINKKHYHWDCAGMKQEIRDCTNLYVSYIDDKSQFPMVMRIINTLVYKNKVPISFIENNIKHSKQYYKDKPVQVLYGIRTLFWEKEIKRWGTFDSRQSGN